MRAYLYEMRAFLHENHASYTQSSSIEATLAMFTILLEMHFNTALTKRCSKKCGQPQKIAGHFAWTCLVAMFARRKFARPLCFDFFGQNSRLDNTWKYPEFDEKLALKKCDMAEFGKNCNCQPLNDLSWAVNDISEAVSVNFRYFRLASIW